MLAAGLDKLSLVFLLGFLEISLSLQLLAQASTSTEQKEEDTQKVFRPLHFAALNSSSIASSVCGQTVFLCVCVYEHVAACTYMVAAIANLWSFMFCYVTTLC